MPLVLAQFNQSSEFCYLAKSRANSDTCGMSYFLLLLLTAFVAADWPDLEVDDCKQPPEYGSCHSHIRMWYYNRNTRSCKPFDYSSCGGNSNRFFTKSECFTHCAPQRTAPINH